MYKKLNIEFDICDTMNPYFMSVVDLSSWALLENSTAYIDVILPGYTKIKENYFDKNSVNILNSFNLGINCVEDCEPGDYEALPDGVYCITVRTDCGEFSATKKYLRTVQLQLDLDKIYINRLKEQDICSDVKTDDIEKIEFLIKAAVAHVRYDSLSKANQLYEMASDLADKARRCTVNKC